MRRLVINILSITLILASVTVFLPANAESTTDSSDEYIFKVAVENRLEQRLYYILSDIVGTKKLVVIANADVETDLKKLEQSRKVNLNRSERSTRLVLPGVPVKKEIGSEKSIAVDIPDISPSVIKKFTITVLVDTSVDESLMDIMRDVAIKAIDYNPDRGDVLNIRRTEFMGRDYDWAAIFYPPDLYWVILIAFVGIFLLSMTFFILNPFKKLTSALRNINWEAMRGYGAKQEEVAQAQALAAREDLPEVRMIDGEKPMPFSFVKERHIPELVFLLRDSKPSEVAVVANYLEPELATKLIESFDEDRQMDIAIALCSEGEVSPEDVQKQEESLKRRLDYVVGGDDRLAPILDYTGDGMRDRIFDKLDSSNPDAARRLRVKVKSFESIMRELSPHGIQALFRQLEPTTFARLLKSAPEDIQDRVLQSLSEGAVERLKEEMELSRPFNEERLKKEKFNVITIVRRMVRAGKLEESV